MSHPSVAYLLLCLCLSSVLSSQSLELGDDCKYEEDVPGECKPVYECAQAIRDMKANKTAVLCAQGATVMLVCCPLEENTTSRSLRLIDRKCLEYSAYVFENTTLPSIISEPVVTQVDRCAFKQVPLIIGGTKALPKQYPHMARLGFGPLSSIQWQCGGSITSRRFILTAAHCTSSRQGPPSYIRVGDFDFDTEDDDARPQTISVDSVMNHPNYSSLRLYNDISLVKLVSAIEFNQYSRPACLNTNFQFPETIAIASGWGASELLGSPSNFLLEATLEFYSIEQCREHILHNRRVPEGVQDDSQICAGARQVLLDTCSGDSGGPLQVFSRIYCMYNIVGITSFGKGCGTGVPGVYTRVSKYIDWIEQHAFVDG